MCNSMSLVNCPSSTHPLGWVLLAVSMPQILHHSEHSCDGREHRLEDCIGLECSKAVSSSLGISCFFFFC